MRKETQFAVSGKTSPLAFSLDSLIKEISWVFAPNHLTLMMHSNYFLTNSSKRGQSKRNLFPEDSRISRLAKNTSR